MDNEKIKELLITALAQNFVLNTRMAAIETFVFQNICDHLPGLAHQIYARKKDIAKNYLESIKDFDFCGDEELNAAILLKVYIIGKPYFDD